MPSLADHIGLLRNTISRDYTAKLREPGGAFAHPFIGLSSVQNLNQL